MLGRWSFFSCLPILSAVEFHTTCFTSTPVHKHSLTYVMSCYKLNGNYNTIIITMIKSNVVLITWHRFKNTHVALLTRCSHILSCLKWYISRHIQTKGNRCAHCYSEKTTVIWSAMLLHFCMYILICRSSSKRFLMTLSVSSSMESNHESKQLLHLFIRQG